MKESVSSALSKRKPYCPPRVQRCRRSFSSPMMLREVRDGALVRLQHVHALDGIPQLALFFEVEPVTLLVALDQHAEEAEQELQVLFCRRQARTG